MNNILVSKVWVAALAAGVLMMLIAATASAASPTQQSRTVIDGVTLPADIMPGYQVVGAITPQEDPCQPVPVLYLQGPYENAETTFDNGDFSRLKAALQQQGLSNVQLSVGGGPGASLDAQRRMIQKWVQSDVDQLRAWGHCSSTGVPKADRSSGQQAGVLGDEHGFGTIQDLTAGDYDTDTGQLADLLAPGYGGNQDYGSYFLNNGLTNGSANQQFIQVGFYFKVDPNSGGVSGYAMWTTDVLFEKPQLMTMAYWPNDTYEAKIYLSNGTWLACMHDLGPLGSGSKCEPTQIGGTELNSDPNTSVFFENENTNQDWYQDWTDNLGNEETHASNAQILVSGSWQQWTGEDHLYASPCNATEPDTVGATGGHLTYLQTGVWNLANIPLAFPPNSCM